jgi:hypothetical protein
VFSRGDRPKPRVYTIKTHHETGRRSIRRTRTTEAQQLTVSVLLKHLGPEAKDKLEQTCLYFELNDGKLELRFEPPGLELRFTSTEQRLGRRLWFLCPYCHRRVGKLYFVKLTFHEVMGCQQCLGLTYPSKARHKCPGDRAIVEGKVDVGTEEWLKAHARERRRLMKLDAQLRKLLGMLDR